MTRSTKHNVTITEKKSKFTLDCQDCKWTTIATSQVFAESLKTRHVDNMSGNMHD